MKISILIILALISKITIADEINKDAYIFQKVSTSEIIMKRNIDELMSPASLSKLPLTHLTLKTFGPEHQIETKIFYSGKINKNQISGDIIVEASADPMLINEKIWEAAIRIKAAGISEIKGDLVIEEGKFHNLSKQDKIRRQKSSSRNAYDALITGFSVNFNVFPIWTQRFKDQTRISTIPTNIENVFIKKRISNSTFKTKVKAERYFKNGNNYITVNGTMKKQGYKDLYVSTGDPSITSARTLKAMLNDLNVKVSGKIYILKKYIKKKTLLYKLKGYKIKKAIEGINKYSNNFMADMLLAKISSLDATNQDLFSNALRY